MKFGRTGLAVLGLFAVSAIGCPQPTHKKNDGGEDMTGGDDTGGMTGSTGGAMGSTGGAMGSTGGSSGADAGSKADSGGGGAAGDAGGGGGGADMTAFTALYTTVIKPKCGPGCHITGNNGMLMMPNAMAAFTNLVNKPSGCTGIMRVTPGDPTKSVLSLIIKPGGVMGCTARPNQMPKGKAPLTAAEITMIDAWIKGP